MKVGVGARRRSGLEQGWSRRSQKEKWVRTRLEQEEPEGEVG